MKDDVKSLAKRAIEDMMKTSKVAKLLDVPKFDKSDVGIAGLVKGVHVIDEYVKPSDMTYDLSYQRDPNKRWATKLAAMAGKFDPRALGALHGVRRSGSEKVWLIDGAGRQLVMTRIKYNEPVLVVIHKHIKDNVAEEAEWFLKLNPEEAAKVNAAQKYKARLVAKDKEALEIEKEAALGGLKVTGSGHAGIPITTATALNAMGCLARVGRIKNELWPDFKVAGQFYIALGAFLESCPTAKMKRMKEAFAVPTNRNYDDVTKEIEAQVYKVYGRDASHARDMAPRAVIVMAERYNKGLAEKNRITPRLTRVNTLLEDFYDQWKPME